jgi:DNA-directed RNA polymerase specialized sigma24 family protein
MLAVLSSQPVGEPGLDPGGTEFPQTRWTRILSCRDSPERQRETLSELLKIYWRPLYFYLRRKGLPRAEAEDAVQGFAVRLLERNFLGRLDPERGRLRGYLKTALNHHLANLREGAAAEKRGGAVQLVPLDFDAAEQALGDDPLLAADEAYQRSWAQSVFARALQRLRVEFESGSRRGPFELLARYFQGESSDSYAEIASAHGMTVPQLKSFLHRARVKFRELVRQEVADTVADAGEIDGELETLVRSL